MNAKMPSLNAPSHQPMLVPDGCVMTFLLQLVPNLRSLMEEAAIPSPSQLSLRRMQERSVSMPRGKSAKPHSKYNVRISDRYYC